MDNARGGHGPGVKSEGISALLQPARSDEDTGSQNRILELLHSMREEQKHFRSIMEACLNRRPEFDRTELKLTFDTIDQYLSKVYSNGTGPNDLDVWEMVWDFVSVCSALNERALLEIGGQGISLDAKNAYELVESATWQPYIQGSRRKRWIF